MFEHACAFCDCARNCEIEPNTIEYRMHSHSVAGIVNSAFACEIFIKTLLVFNGESIDKIKSHKLKSLWEKLKAVDANITDQVEQSIISWFNSENEHLFEELLDITSNAFEYWRYIYEKDSGKINMNFLSGFRKLLREVCCNQLFEKTWEEYKQ